MEVLWKIKNRAITWSSNSTFVHLSEEKENTNLKIYMGSHIHCSIIACLLSHFSRVRLCATPQMAAHQALPPLEFSRQEHWSGLPFSSPMHESEKWKWSCSVMSDPQRPHGLQPSRLLHPWDFPGKHSGVGVPLPSPIYDRSTKHIFTWPFSNI